MDQNVTELNDVLVAQEIVVFRDNLQNRMRKLCLLAPNGEGSLIYRSTQEFNPLTLTTDFWRHADQTASCT